MHADFWHERWAQNQIGFHESAVNPLLVTHFAILGLPPAARIFLPLCGKTVDIDWLLAQGYRVAGAELSPIAATQLFERLGLVPAVEARGPLQRWSAASLEVFVGDFFSVSGQMLGAVDAIYDRAAMIALPPDMRRQYVAHLDAISGKAPQLLVTLDYEQQCMPGPPFAVSSDELRECHGDRKPMLLATQAMPGGLKGRCPATENVWLLR